MRLNVYIDAFNLYYGCVKNTPYRWLNLGLLCKRKFPNDQINHIKYFTALVSARPNDPDKPVRQQTFIRALETLPNLTVIYGSFLSHVIWMPLAYPVSGGPTYVQVIKTEEKGSDVNLATHLLNDGHLGLYEVAVVVSNDSDLAEPIRIVINQLGLPVGVLNPQIGKGKKPSWQLLQTATFFRHIRKNDLKNSPYAAD